MRRTTAFTARDVLTKIAIAIAPSHRAVLQGFINQFGDANAKGVYAISSLHTSLLSSLAFVGKFAGCFCAGPLIERCGHRAVFLILAAVSYVGIVSTYSAITLGDGRSFARGCLVLHWELGSRKLGRRCR